MARDTSTVTIWLQKYRTVGLSGLLEIKKAAGAKRKINDDVIPAFIQELKTGKGFSSYGGIVESLKKEHGLDIEYGTVAVASIWIWRKTKSTTSSKLQTG